jgi:hypothetical protein
MTQPLSGPKPAPAVNYDCSENEGMQAYSFAQKVFDRLDTLGLGETPLRPMLEEEHNGIWQGLRAGQYFDGRLPTVIRRLNLDQVSALYSLYAAWYRYLIFITRKVATERSEAIRKKEYLWSHVRKSRKQLYKAQVGKALPEQEASDQARGDSRYVTANAAYEEHNNLFEILSAMCEVAQQDMKVISREVTIQQEAFKQRMIGNGMGNRGQTQDWSGTYGGDNGSGGFRQRAVQATPGPVPGPDDAPDESDPTGMDSPTVPTEPGTRGFYRPPPTSARSGRRG